MSLNKALGLAKIGLYVIPCKQDKSPHTENGFKDATTDPATIKKWWKENPKALVGVATGMSGLDVLDVDVKRDALDDIVVDGFNSIDENWLDIPETFSYHSVRGEGAHYVYSANKELSPAAGYRGMEGVDRRSGGSYVVWTGPVPESRDEFKATPEWLEDEVSQVRTIAEFTGELEDWFAALTPGPPNVLVRHAIERISDDFSHQEMVSAQHEAIRLGAEGNPGVPDLIARLEDAWLSRPAEHHTTPEEAWEFKFAESLASGIQKYGGTTELLKSLPEYSPNLIPQTVSPRLFTGEPGGREVYRDLQRELLRAGVDDLTTLSVLWNAPTTRDTAREWGLEFCHKRITEARIVPEPETENPALETVVTEHEKMQLLSDEEYELVRSRPTFIDRYCDAIYRNSGFVNRDLAEPAAWSLLSMAFGHRAFVPASMRLPLNLWFIRMAYSGTGKSATFEFEEACQNLLNAGDTEEAYYNLGSESSPEGLHEALLRRDKMPSIMLSDEAASFFKGLKNKEWMSSLEHFLSNWYGGKVPGSNKIRLKELRGKSATTSLSLSMLATPDRMLSLVDKSMFDTGFLARVNWTWTPKPEDREYVTTEIDTDDSGIPSQAYELVMDLMLASAPLSRGDKQFKVRWTEESRQRLDDAYNDMRALAKSTDTFATTEQAVTRLRETMWKCAALLALHRGDERIRIDDATISVYYVEQWFNTMFRVVEAAGRGDFNNDVKEIVEWVSSQRTGVSERRLRHKFSKFITRSPRELDDRIEESVRQGLLLREVKNNNVIYRGNGVKE